MPASTPRIVWISRLLLAALFLFGSEVLFWNNPAGRAPLDWAGLAIGYIVLATLGLDVIVRYRVRDVWGILLIMGGYGLLNGLLLNPTSVLRAAPNTLISHGLGGHWSIGLEMIGVWMVLRYGTGRHIRLLLLGAVVVGFNWGVWVWWFPVFNPGAYAPVLVWQMFAIALLAVLPALMLAILQRIAGLPSEQAYRLSARSWVLGGCVIFAFVAYRALMRQYEDGLGVLLSLLILGIFWVVLWFRGDTRRPSLLATPAQPLNLLWLVPVIAIFAAVGGYATTLPLVNLFGLNQFSLLTVVFAALGTLWMPFTAAVLGYHAVIRQLQTQKL